VFQGSAETVLYVVALYFGSVQVRNIRYTLWAGLVADFVGIVTAIWVSYLFFG
jgi:spore maturation protein SpmB